MAGRQDAGQFVQRLKDAEVTAFRQHVRRRSTLKWVTRLGLVLVLLGFWEFGAGVLFDESFSASPSRIVLALVRLVRSGVLVENLVQTVTEIFAGYAIGVCAAIICASFFSFSRRVYVIIFPFIQAFYGIPKVALAPILVMWFGLGITPKIILAAIMSFFVVFVNTVMGLNSARQELLNISRVMGASRLQATRKILFPVALPYTVTAMRVATASAVLGAILGEFVAAQRGIGVLINRGSSQLAPDTVFAGVLILTILTLVLSSLLIPLERWIARRDPKKG